MPSGVTPDRETRIQATGKGCQGHIGSAVIFFTLDIRKDLHGAIASRTPACPCSLKFLEIAEKCGLDIDKFKGVRYRVTTKASIKKSQKESLKEFSKRCLDRIESYDIAVPKEKLIPEKVYAHFMSLLKQMRALEGKEEDEVPQNFTYCESYFKPCPYWSQCYGKTFTANAEQYEIFDTETIPNLTVEPSEDEDLDFL